MIPVSGQSRRIKKLVSEKNVRSVTGTSLDGVDALEKPLRYRRREGGSVIPAQ
jgi:hypothetical protein